MHNIDASLIADFSLFEGVTTEQLHWIVANAHSRLVSHGQPVFTQDAEATSFFLILDGHVRAVRTTPDGEQVTVRYFAIGDPIGIAQAIGRKTYPASAIAVTDCIVLFWPMDFWTELAEKIPTFSINASREIGARLTESLDRIVEMTTEQVERRIARALLRLTDQNGRKTDEGILIDFPISRQDIAEMTGTTLHTVSRLLSSWEGDRLVKSGRQKVTVVDPNRLFLLADGRKSARPA